MRVDGVEPPWRYQPAVYSRVPLPFSHTPEARKKPPSLRLVASLTGFGLRPYVWKPPSSGSLTRAWVLSTGYDFDSRAALVPIALPCRHDAKIPCVHAGFGMEDGRFCAVTMDRKVDIFVFSIALPHRGLVAGEGFEPTTSSL